MRDLAQHPAERGGVLVRDARAGPLEAERLQRPLRGLLLADRALVLVDLDPAHETATGSSVGRLRRSRPRVSSTASAEQSTPSASMVAMTTVTAFVLPSDLDLMPWMPADSTTAR